jgi:hypothetical protein
VEPAPLEQFFYFATPIYITKQPQYLEAIKDASLRNLDETHGDKKLDKLYPFRMSDNLLGDTRVAAFAEFVGNTAWNILASQGYAMDGLATSFTELWCQEHHRTSSMDCHVHGGGNALVGFYFLDTPKGSPPIVIHDPRPARMMLDLPQADVNQASLASTMINFVPEPGMLLFAPSWLPHSFGRSAAKSPFRFIHFNLAVRLAVPEASPTAEIV